VAATKKMGLPMTMNATKWPARLYSLDVSRGVAALSVVIWHWQHFAYQGASLPKGFEQDSMPLFSLLKLFYEMGHAGVQYFFLLSGFVFFWLYRAPIRNRKILPKTFFLQRFSRLYPLHFATLLVVALLQMLFIAHDGNFFVYQFNDVYNFFCT
jgi:peptidoglycan/LPS O-acetylase OafA/YrhL